MSTLVGSQRVGVEATPLDVPAVLPNGSAWPRISIVTPSLNQGRYIEETILSVAEQGYPNLEHIVIDGGSQDETRSRLESHRYLLKHFVSEPDRGQSHAINKGMEIATGEILSWLNADDRLAPGALFSVAMGFYRRDVDIVAGVCELFTDAGLIGWDLPSAPPGPLRLTELLDLDEAWTAGRFFHQPEVFFTRALWERAGGYVDEKLTYSMDYELWLRFASAGARLHVIGRPVAQFRIHDQQKTFEPARYQPELRTCRDRFVAEHSIGPEPPRGSTTRTSLHIALLNDHGFKHGAGIAHGRFGEAIAQAGHRVSCFQIADEPGIPPEAQASNVDIVEQVLAACPDLVIVGNIHSVPIDPVVIAAIAERVPTLCVLHDFWWLSGRCTYTLGRCEKYLTGCDDTCPTPSEYPALPPDRIADAWIDKRAVFVGGRAPVLLANSPWTEQYAKRAFAPGAGPAIEQFRLAIPMDTFIPIDKAIARQFMDIPESAFVLLTNGDLEDERKGSFLLIDALSELNIPGLLVVSLSSTEPRRKMPVPFRRIPYVTDARCLATIYSAADVFVGGSLEETFGQVFVEAAACGTPCVGFDTTGISTSVCDGVTGILVTEITPRGLARAIDHVYRDPSLRRNLGFWGRKYVENEFSAASAYYHFFVALERLGLRQNLGLRSKISFQAQTVGLPMPAVIAPGGQPRLAEVELTDGPLPSFALGTFDWITASGLTRTVNLLRGGDYLVLVTYRNVQPSQTLRLNVNGSGVPEFPLAVTGLLNDNVLLFRADLRAGLNAFEFACRRYSTPLPKEPEQRHLGALLTRVQLLKVGL